MILKQTQKHNLTVRHDIVTGGGGVLTTTLTRTDRHNTVYTEGESKLQGLLYDFSGYSNHHLGSRHRKSSVEMKQTGTTVF